MGKIDFYIHFTICDETYRLSKKSKYSAYTVYCKALNVMFDANDLTIPMINDILEVCFKLELIYGISPEEASEYISTFFANNLYLKYEGMVIFGNELEFKLK